MHRRKKEILLWAIYVLVVISVLMWLAVECASGASRKNRWPIQGSGAADLIAPTAKTLSFPPMTMAIVLPPRLYTNTLAWDYADLSTVTNFRIYRGPSPGVYTASNLTGKALSAPFIWTSRTTNWVSVTAMGTSGLESEHSNEIQVPPIYTNLVITITTINATNLQWRLKADAGAWTKLGATNYTATNPPPRMWRAMGKSRPSLFIANRWQ